VLELPIDNVTGCARNHALAGQHFGERLGGPIRADNPEHGEQLLRPSLLIEFKPFPRV
jgi:hypothetical protein